MPVVLAFFGAAVAWLIATVTILATGGSPAWAYLCLGMAVAFSVLDVALYTRERAKDPEWIRRKFNDDIRRAASEARANAPPIEFEARWRADPLSNSYADVAERA